jgi:hypothetical protein
MVPLTHAPSEFAGRVLVAKLGSAGIIAELRGVSEVYPGMFGTPQVWVEAQELSEARELIAADLDDAYAPAPSGSEPARTDARRTLRPLLVVVALLVLASFAVGIRSCGTSSPPATSHTQQ